MACTSPSRAKVTSMVTALHFWSAQSLVLQNPGLNFHFFLFFPNRLGRGRGVQMVSLSSPEFYISGICLKCTYGKGMQFSSLAALAEQMFCWW